MGTSKGYSSPKMMKGMGKSRKVKVWKSHAMTEDRSELYSGARQ